MADMLIQSKHTRFSYINNVLHVVSDVDGVQLVGQKAVAKVHTLFLASGIYGNYAGIYYDHYSYDQVMLLQYCVCY